MKETEEYASCYKIRRASHSTTKVRMMTLGFLNDSLDKKLLKVLVPIPKIRIWIQVSLRVRRASSHSLSTSSPTNLNPREGDLVVVHLRRIGRDRKRRLVTKSGIVEEVDSKVYVKTNTCSKKFRKVVEILHVVRRL